MMTHGNLNEDEKSAADILAEAAKTFAERRAVYGNNWKRTGEALKALFPDGINLASSEDHDRFHIMSLILVKLSRYAVAWDRGEMHQDSIHDACVYCAMLEAIDEGIRARHRDDRTDRQSNDKDRKTT